MGNTQTIHVEKGDHIGVFSGGLPFRAQVVVAEPNKHGWLSVVPTDGYIPPCHEAGEALFVEPSEIITILPAYSALGEDMEWLRSLA